MIDVRRFPESAFLGLYVGATLLLPLLQPCEYRQGLFGFSVAISHRAKVKYSNSPKYVGRSSGLKPQDSPQLFAKLTSPRRMQRRAFKASLPDKNCVAAFFHTVHPAIDQHLCPRWIAAHLKHKSQTFQAIGHEYDVAFAPGFVNDLQGLVQMDRGIFEVIQFAVDVTQETVRQDQRFVAIRSFSLMNLIVACRVSAPALRCPCIARTYPKKIMPQTSKRT